MTRMIQAARETGAPALKDGATKGETESGMETPRFTAGSRPPAAPGIDTAGSIGMAVVRPDTFAELMPFPAAAQAGRPGATRMSDAQTTAEIKRRSMKDSSSK